MSVYTQEFSLRGKVVDENNQPLSYVNIILNKPYSETFLKGTSTDNDGNFEINGLKPEEYVYKVSFIGFKTITGRINLKQNTVLPDIILVEDAEALDQVTITSKKPTIIRKPDRLTFNIENTALTEGSTLQVLRSTPGIIVQNGSINIKSSAATIYINNRRVQLNSDELLQLLESAPANSIKSVDVITNPPASYDADSGPVVNIVMSKNLISGYRGSVSTNYTQGVFPRYNGAMSHYFKNDKINFNLNYSYTNQKINRDENTQIDFLDTNNNINEVWEPSIDRNTNSETHNINLNLDYYLSDKTTLSLTSTGLFVPYFRYNLNNNTVINDANSNFQSRFTADNLTRDDKFNIGTDLELNTNFKNKSRLTFAGHYTVYNYDRDQNVISNFFDGNNMLSSSSEFNTISNQDTNIFSLKADYSLPTGDSSSLEAGIKFSNINTESDITKFDVMNGNATIDPANSNAFDYNENTYAAYINYTKSWEKWDLTLGVRVEQTNLEGVSPTLNQTNTQDYFEWFPNASLSHNISDKLMVFANYKRSIARPNYTDLNPFTFFLNESLIVVGNPNLLPSITDYYSIGINFLEHFTISHYRSRNQGVIYEIPRQNNTNNILAYTPTNIDEAIDYGFDFEVDYRFSNRWSVYAATSFFNINESNNFNGEVIDLERWANYSTISNSISFLEDESLSLSLNFTWTSSNLIALNILKPQLFTDVSISKSLWNNKGMISLGVQDFFNRHDQQATIRYLNQSSRNDIDLDNRFVRIGFRYKFGNTKLSTNERTTDIDERDRIKDLN